MTSVNDLKKGDILYGLDLSTLDIEIYSINGIVDRADSPCLSFDLLFGKYDGGYIMFPDECDLETPILCKYLYETDWIYTINFDYIETIVKSDFPNLEIAFYCNTYVSMSDLSIHKLED